MRSWFLPLRNPTRIHPGRALRGGFTLIELMVVVAIIAVVASLLMPAITMARLVANQAACMSNLRQVSMASMAYQDDNNGLFVRYQVYGETAHQVFGDNDIWFNELMPYFERDAGRTRRLELARGKVKSAMWGCPSFRNDSAGAWAWRPGFAMNHRLGLPEDGRGSYYYGNLSHAGGFTDFNVARVTHPSTRVVFGCSYGARLNPSSATPGVFGGTKGAEIRHRGRANYAFVDGHVQSRSPVQAWYGMTNPGHAEAQ